MLIVEDGVIAINKGDRGLALDMTLSAGGQTYVLEEGDVLTLTVRELPTAESPILYQTHNIEGQARFIINADGGIEVGKYSCDVQLTKANGDINTVFPVPTQYGKKSNYKNFIVNSEVTIDAAD